MAYVYEIYNGKRRRFEVDENGVKKQCQVKKKGVAMIKLMGSRTFLRGYKDYVDNRPFDDLAGWNYERGRMFAAATHGRVPLKIGRSISPAAVQEAYAMLNRKELL